MALLFAVASCKPLLRPIDNVIPSAPERLYFLDGVSFLACSVDIICLQRLALLMHASATERGTQTPISPGRASS